MTQKRFLPTFSSLTPFLCLVGGIIFGLFPLPFVLSASREIGELFVRLLKLLSAPMVFLAIVSTLTQIDNVSTVRSMAKKILKYTLLTTLLAAGFGLVFFLVFCPAGPMVGKTQLPEALNLSYWSSVKSMIPENFFAPFLENNVLALALIATALSFALHALPKEKTAVTRGFFQSLFDALLVITEKVMLIIPLVIFVFTVQLTSELRSDMSAFRPFLWYSVCIIGANVFQGFVVLPALLKWKKHRPTRLAKGMMPALTVAFLSKSSSVALPVSLRCAIHRLKIGEKTARFSFPLCSVINMNGCAAFILITTLFVCKSHGIVFNPLQLASVVVISTLAAIGNAGVPMGCFFLTSALLMGIGVPLELMGMILPMYAIFDMIETALNVWSDSAVTALVDKEIGLANEKIAGSAAPCAEIARSLD